MVSLIFLVEFWLVPSLGVSYLFLKRWAVEPVLVTVIFFTCFSLLYFVLRGDLHPFVIHTFLGVAAILIFDDEIVDQIVGGFFPIVIACFILDLISFISFRPDFLDSTRLQGFMFEPYLFSYALYCGLAFIIFKTKNNKFFLPVGMCIAILHQPDYFGLFLAMNLVTLGLFSRFTRGVRVIALGCLCCQILVIPLIFYYRSLGSFLLFDETLAYSINLFENIRNGRLDVLPSDFDFHSLAGLIWALLGDVGVTIWVVVTFIGAISLLMRFEYFYLFVLLASYVGSFFHHSILSAVNLLLLLNLSKSGFGFILFDRRRRKSI